MDSRSFSNNKIMTAEIAVMNKQAIALAADSAVTFRTEKNQKIFISANKIFCLSDNHPVGVMVYGNASLLQVPWETVIKTYSKKLGTKRFDKLSDYCKDFLKFIGDNRVLFPAKEQEKYISRDVGGYFNYLRDKTLNTIKGKLEKKDKLSREDIAVIISDIIREEYEGWQKAKLLRGVTKVKVSNFRRKHIKGIRKIRKNIFEKTPLNGSLTDKLDQIAIWLFFKFHDNVSNQGTSGLVIAGYGEKDIFPSLNYYTIEGIADNFLKYKQDGNFNVSFQMGAAIVPFAQKEMVVRFIEGIDPTFRNFIAGGLRELAAKYPSVILDNLKLNAKRNTKLGGQIHAQVKKATDEFLQKFKKIRREYFVDPILQVVGFLPKDELAMMAETLITLTSFKRRVSMEAETVGGPIDVVVISRGDGLVWIKRKKYFDKNIQT